MMGLDWIKNLSKGLSKSKDELEEAKIKIEKDHQQRIKEFEKELGYTKEEFALTLEIQRKIRLRNAYMHRFFLIEHEVDFYKGIIDKIEQEIQVTKDNIDAYLASLRKSIEDRKSEAEIRAILDEKTRLEAEALAKISNLEDIKKRAKDTSDKIVELCKEEENKTKDYNTKAEKVKREQELVLSELLVDVKTIEKKLVELMNYLEAKSTTPAP